MAGEVHRTLEQMNAAQKTTIEQLTNQVKNLEKKLADAQIWERFAGYLLDNCEMQQVTEENLQSWLGSMLEKEKNAKDKN